MAAARNVLPAAYRKLVATKVTQKFRGAVQIVSTPMPTPKAGEVIVKNRFVGVNASDINYTAARYDPSLRPPFDIGFEGVGEVVAIGDECPGISLGQPVAYMKYGAFAEYMKMPCRHAMPLPLPKAQAEIVPLLVSGLTASISLDKIGEIKEGEKVLVTAAAGGTGQFAVQWAKLAGCHVIGTCSTDEKVELLKKLGCDRPINTSKEDLKQVLKEEYASGVDVVYETIGGKVFDVCVDSLAKGGRLVVIGFIEGYQSDSGVTSARTATLPIKLLTKSASVRGFFLFSFPQYVAEYLGKLIQLYKKGSLQVITDNGVNHPRGPFVGLESVEDAVDYLFSRKSRGKVVVEIPENLTSKL